MGALIEHRVPCNKALARHPRCQVAYQEGKLITGVSSYAVGMLGILVGLLEPLADGPKKGWPPILLEVEGECSACGLRGEALEEKGWKSGDEDCPLCMEALDWHPLYFKETEV